MAIICITANSILRVMPLEVTLHYYFSFTVVSTGLFEIALSEDYSGIKFPNFNEALIMLQISFFSLIEIFYFNKGL